MERAGHPARSIRSVLVLAMLLALPSSLLGVWWVASDSHQVVPGLSGCGWIRARQPQIDCYTRQFSGLVRDRGLQRAMDVVDRRAAGSTTLSADCHLAWHPLGEAGGRADARSGVPYAGSKAMTTCRQGYAHGYTIGYLIESRPDMARLATTAVQACSASVRSVLLLHCVHAFGHTMARHTKGDANAAVKGCQQVDYSSLPGGSTQLMGVRGEPPVVTATRHQCLYGAYMEVALIDVAGGTTVTNNCVGARGYHARKACYAYLPSRAVAMEGRLEAGARACETLAPAGEMQLTCVKYFAFGLDSPARCTLLARRVDRAVCADVFAARERAAAISAQTTRPADRARMQRTPPKAPPAVTVPADLPGLDPPQRSGDSDRHLR